MADNVDEILKRRDRIQSELNALQSKAAVAKAESERLGKAIKEDLTKLKDEFGVDSVDKAIALRDQMVEELTSLCDKLEEQINSINESINQ